MPASACLHEPESMGAGCRNRTYWLKIIGKGSCELSIFFDSPSEMILMLHAALDSALEMEQRELTGGEDADSNSTP